MSHAARARHPGSSHQPSAHLGVLRGRHDATDATSGAELNEGQHPGPNQFENGPPLPPRIAFLVQETSRMKALLSVFLTPQSTLRSRTVCAKKGAPSSCLSCNRQENTRSPPKGSSQILLAEDLRGFF